MKTRLLLFMFVLTVSFSVAGGEDPHPLYLWETSHGDARIFMVGSIHLLTDDFYPLPELILDAADQADVLIFEADVADLDQEAMTLLVLQHGMYLDGTTLVDHVPEKLYRTAINRAEELGIPEMQAMMMRPWLLSLSLTTGAESLAEFDQDLGMEMYFSRRLSGKDILELEGAAFQMELMAGLEEKDQILMLESSLVDDYDLGQMVADILAAWKTGDDDMLDVLLNDPYGMTRNLNRRLITGRNAGMTAGILELTAGSDDTFLVLVGTAHFIGNQGLPMLLAGEGLEVVRYLSDGSGIPVR